MEKIIDYIGNFLFGRRSFMPNELKGLPDDMPIDSNLFAAIIVILILIYILKSWE